MLTIPPELAAVNLRASRSRTDANDESLRHMKYFLVLFLSIFGSVFLNSLNFLARRVANISLTAVLAFAVDAAIIIVYPPHLVFPLLVAISSIFALSSAGRPLRQSVLVASCVLGFVVALSIEPSVKYKPWMLKSVGQCVGVQIGSLVLAFISHRGILARINFFCGGLLLTCSVMVMKSIAVALQEKALLSVPLGISGLAILILLRRSMRLTLRNQVTAQYSSWSVLFVSLTFFDPSIDRGFPLVLSILVAILLRFIVASPVATGVKLAEPDQPAQPVPMAAVTLTQRRKVITSTPDEVLEEDLPTASEVSTTTVVIVKPVVSASMVEAEIDADEDEVFRRIANSS